MQRLRKGYMAAVECMQVLYRQRRRSSCSEMESHFWFISSSTKAAIFLSMLLVQSSVLGYWRGSTVCFMACMYSWRSSLSFWTWSLSVWGALEAPQTCCMYEQVDLTSFGDGVSRTISLISFAQGAFAIF